MKISQKQVEAVTALPGPKRYWHFIKVVADQEQVWGLYNNGWALAATNEENQTVFPVWPALEYAELCKASTWPECTPKPIEIDEFIETVIPELREEGIKLCIFYLATNSGVVPEYDEFLNDLNSELAQYE